MVQSIHFRYKVMLAIGIVMALLLVMATTTLAAPKESPAPAPSRVLVHWVRWGETLSSIGRHYGVNAWTIARYNGIRNPNYVRAGQRLWIPVGYGPYHPVSYHPYYGGRMWHVVHRGETLASIAWRYGRSVYAIARTNGIRHPNFIYAGQRLWIP